jgi:hypothetical protein
MNYDVTHWNEKNITVVVQMRLRGSLMSSEENLELAKTEKTRTMTRR